MKHFVSHVFTKGATLTKPGWLSDSLIDSSTQLWKCKCWNQRNWLIWLTEWLLISPNNHSDLCSQLFIWTFLVLRGPLLHRLYWSLLQRSKSLKRTLCSMWTFCQPRQKETQLWTSRALQLFFLLGRWVKHAAEQQPGQKMSWRTKLQFWGHWEIKFSWNVTKLRRAQCSGSHNVHHTHPAAQLLSLHSQTNGRHTGIDPIILIHYFPDCAATQVSKGQSLIKLLWIISMQRTQTASKIAANRSNSRCPPLVFPFLTTCTMVTGGSVGGDDFFFSRHGKNNWRSQMKSQWIFHSHFTSHLAELSRWPRSDRLHKSYGISTFLLRTGNMSICCHPS